MASFPLQDFTEQYISRSYQDILQQYSSSSYLYVLDGLGNVVFNIPSASVGSTVITSDVTSSMIIGNLDGGVPDSIYGGISAICNKVGINVGNIHNIFSLRKPRWL